MKVFGSNFDGLNRLGNSRYSASLMPPGVGVIMGQEASTLASEYGPQWMNMPNLASRYQRVRSLAKPEPNPRLRINGSDDPASASFMKPRREGEQVLTKAEMLSRHPHAQNRLGSLKGHCTCAARRLASCVTLSLKKPGILADLLTRAANDLTVA